MKKGRLGFELTGKFSDLTMKELLVNFILNLGLFIIVFYALGDLFTYLEFSHTDLSVAIVASFLNVKIKLPKD